MSLSLDPPLVLISVDKGAQCYACFNLQNGFTVNFLSEDQEEVSRRFATKGIDKFAGLQLACRATTAQRFLMRRLAM